MEINVGNGNNFIDKIVNLIINIADENNLINKVTNMTINYIGNDLNQENASDVQVQFEVDPAGKTHQHLLSSQMIGIQHDEIPVLSPPTEPRMGMNNPPV